MPTEAWLITDGGWDDREIPRAVCDSEAEANELLAIKCGKIHNSHELPPRFQDTEAGRAAEAARKAVFDAGQAANPDAYKNADLVYNRLLAQYNRDVWEKSLKAHCQIHTIHRFEVGEWQEGA